MFLKSALRPFYLATAQIKGLTAEFFFGDKRKKTPYCPWRAITRPTDVSGGLNKWLRMAWWSGVDQWNIHRQ